MNLISVRYLRSLSGGKTKKKKERKKIVYSFSPPPDLPTKYC